MAGRTAYLRRARHWIANRGWKGFAQELWHRGRLHLSGDPLPGRENGNQSPHPFDISYGTDTGGLLWGEALQGVQTARGAQWATGYYGISPSAFTSALRELDLDWSRFTFVDIGCGKGRALLLALRFPFRSVYGVELSAPLAATAQQNLQGFRADWRYPDVPASVQQGDATQVALPSGPLLLFLYHPFAAPVMRSFLRHLARSLQAEPRQVILLYANPELSPMLTGWPGCERLWQHTFSLTPAEGAADRFGSYGEVFAAFRMSASLSAEG